MTPTVNIISITNKDEFRAMYEGIDFQYGRLGKFYITTQKQYLLLITNKCNLSIHVSRILLNYVCS